MSPSDRAFAQDELERWVKAGFIRRLDEAEREAVPCVSPAFVSHVRSKPRLVLDLRQVNEHFQEIKFKYEALVEFMSALHPLDHLISWDIKDAYHHVLMNPSDRPYLSFVVGSDVYEPITMPFGLSIAPWAWTKVMRPVLAHLRRKGLTLLGYVDDHGAVAAGPRPCSKADAQKGFREVVRLYDRRGLILHTDKGDREGTRQLTLLGYTLDTEHNQVRLPDDRLAKLRGTAAAVLAAASKNRRWVRPWLLQSVAGIIVSGSLAIPEARLFARAIYDDVAGGDGRSDCRLSHHSIRDLRFWASFGRSGHGRPIWLAAPASTLHTDASSYGWGGVAADGTEARGFFTGAETAWHINVKEVAAIRFSLTSLEDLFRAGDRVRMVTDSRVALHVTNALVSRSPALCSELRRLYGVASDLGVTLEAEWIPTAQNVQADKLSRARDSTDWRLAPTFFAQLDSRWGLHDVDRFATHANRQLERCNSLVRDQGRAPLDALQQDWSKDNNWANSPFDSIPLVLKKIFQDRASATVIIPVWRAQPWWQPALRQANEIVYLRRRGGLFLRGAGGTPAAKPHWRVAALRFKRGGRAPPPGCALPPLRQSGSLSSAPARAARPRRICSPTNWRTRPRIPTRPSGPSLSRFSEQAGTRTSPPPLRWWPATSGSYTSAARWRRAPSNTTSPRSTLYTRSNRCSSRPSARC